MDEARRQYGPDPLVLSVRRGEDDEGWEALVARETPDAHDEDQTVRAPAISDEVLKTRPLAVATATPRIDPVGTMRKDLAAILRQAHNPKRGSMPELLDFARRLAKLEEDLCASMLSAERVGRSWLPLLDKLDKSGFPKADAVRLIQSIDKTPAPGAELTEWTHHFRRLRRALADTIEVAPSEERIRPGLAVFVGGAGVGKTTLAAKLAADLCLGGSTAPILGAVMPRPGVGLAALKRCANTLGIEFVEANSAADLEALEARSHEGPVVLDTASVNPFDNIALERLGGVLRALKRPEIHTVVPATHSSRDFAQALSAFFSVGANRLAVTRLDEGPFIGRVLAAAHRANAPISYFSQGPRIPDDLLRPGVEALVDAVLEPERMQAA